MIGHDFVSRAATPSRSAVRDRYLFGPGAFSAPIAVSAQGTSVSGAGKQTDTFAMGNPAADSGAVAGLRPWSHPV